jgi:hypothetical protein
MPLKVCVRQRRWWWWCSFSFSAGFFLFAFLLFVYRFTSEPKLLPPSHCCADISRFLLFPSLKKYVITKDSKIGDSISSVVVVPIPYNSFFVFFCDGQVFQSRRELRRALWRHRGTEWGGGRLLFYDGNSLVRLCSPLLLLYSLSGRIQCITSTGWAAITKNKERRKENKNARI